MCLLVAALLCCSTRALAETKDVAFEAALRVGVGLPIGGAGNDQDLGDIVSTVIPLQLDAGVRLFSSLFLGAYFQYGFAMLDDSSNIGCSESGLVDLDCSGNNLRLGIQAHYHFMPSNQFDPWIGLGFGYEWLTVSAEGGGVEVSWTLSGFEFASLQAGLDIAVSEQFRLGPFLQFSFAQYSSMSVDCSGGGLCTNALGASGDIQETELHDWLIIGVRGAFGT
ncbi:MAG TPA: outer membrane beta-barrel protein [Polyangiales bacterium]|nr:outer membrane beta-barrel protein [Polyangiales bacterium]